MKVLAKKDSFFYIVVAVMVLMAISTLYALVFAPPEYTMGDVQRIFYIHLAVAINGMVGIIVAFIFAILYLIKRKLKFDLMSAAAVKVVANLRDDDDEPVESSIDDNKAGEGVSVR